MNVLFVGDVVGPQAVEYLAGRLQALRRDLNADLAVVNAENCGPSGVGMTVQLVERLLGAGADVITAGNHAFDGPEADAVLAHPRVLRPLNVSDGVAGRGTLTLETDAGPATVLVLADRAALALAPAVSEPPVSPHEAWLRAPRRGTVLVDFHAQSVMEKQAFAHAVDREAAAVLGTHTHEPTLHLDVLPGGTAFVTEVGMTGCRSGPQGFEPDRFIEIARGADRAAVPPPRPALGPITLGAVLVHTQRGAARAVQRVT